MTDTPRNTPTRPVWLDEDDAEWLSLAVRQLQNAARQTSIAARPTADRLATILARRDASPADPVEAVAKVLFSRRDWQYDATVPWESLSDLIQDGWRGEAKFAIQALGGFPLETT